MTMTGFYTLWLMVGGSLFSIGSALLSTLDKSSGTPKIVGYQFLVSAGFGFGVQLLLVAMQDVLLRADILWLMPCTPFFKPLAHPWAWRLARRYLRVL
ncbi:hypothetical protein F4782DRAFT_524338 [Xylaria castorea]|nr:hypothetical protein F4782DRAFT_524338 [Xylaria castorea]